MKVAYIGLGSMGAPHARLLAQAGVDLAVYDPFPDALRKFDGVARLGSSVADASANADVVCVCVRDDQQVRDVVLGPDGLETALAPGALVLVHSTVSIDLLHELDASLRPRGIGLVDAPVSRTRSDDSAKFVYTMLGGEESEVARALGVVDAFSTEAAHMGPLGAGMASKIANNLVTWVHIVVGAQAANLAAHHGVAFDKLRAVMKSNGNLTPTMQQLLDAKSQSTGQPNPQRDAFQASQAGNGEKDLSLAIKAAQPAGIDMGVADAAKHVVRAIMTSPLTPVRS